MVLPTAESQFGTVLTAMVTPFSENGDLDLEGAAKVARHLVALGHDGLVVGGTTGESPTTSEEEKAAVIQAVRAAIGPDIKLVAGAGSNDTRHAAELAKQAADAGADAILAVSPYYSKPPQAGLIAHFEAIAEATDLPVMLYDIPGRCGVAIGDMVIDHFSGHPKIRAVKDATGNIPQAAARIQRSDLAWYSGDDALNLAFLAVGAVGVVSVAGHVTGADLAALVAAARRGDMDGARKAADDAAPVVAAVCGSGQGAAMAKAAVQAIGVIGSRQTRLPVLPASDEDFVTLCSALFDYGYKEALA